MNETVEIEIEIADAIEAEVEMPDDIEIEIELSPLTIVTTELKRAEKIGDEYAGPAVLIHPEIQGDMDGDNKVFTITGGYKAKTLMVFKGSLDMEIEETDPEAGIYTCNEAPSQFVIMMALYEQFAEE